MKRLLSVIPFAYLLLRFELKFASQFVQMLLVAILTLIYILYNNKYWKKCSKMRCIVEVLFIFVLFIAIAAVYIFVHGTGDTSYILTIVQYIYNLLFWDALIIHVMKLTSKGIYGSEKEAFIVEYSNIMTLYILFTLICIAVPTFKEWWISIIHSTDTDLMLSRQTRYMARISWNGFAGFGATFRCSLGIVFCLDAIRDREKQSIYAVSNQRLYFYIAVMLLGNVMYGRMGIVASLIVILFFTGMRFIKDGKIGLIIFILVSVALSAIFIIYLKNRVKVIEYIYNWSFEPLINYLTGKGFTSGSTDGLFNMYRDSHMSLKTFFWGDGYYLQPGRGNVSGRYYKSVDPGILRFLFFWGLFPSLLAYLILFFMIRRSIFNDRNTIIMLLIVLILFEFKGETCMVAMYIFGSLLILSSERKSKKIRLKINRSIAIW